MTIIGWPNLTRTHLDFLKRTPDIIYNVEYIFRCIANQKINYKTVLSNVTRQGVTIDRVWIGSRIYWTLQHTLRDYTLQNTITHKLVYSVTVPHTNLLLCRQREREREKRLHPEGPATGQLDQGLVWFSLVPEQMPS
jgi:hypothetical protein